MALFCPALPGFPPSPSSLPSRQTFVCAFFCGGDQLAGVLPFVFLMLALQCYRRVGVCIRQVRSSPSAPDPPLTVGVRYFFSRGFLSLFLRSRTFFRQFLDLLRSFICSPSSSSGDIFLWLLRLSSRPWFGSVFLSCRGVTLLWVVSTPLLSSCLTFFVLFSSYDNSLIFTDLLFIPDSLALCCQRSLNGSGCSPECRLLPHGSRPFNRV